MFFELTAPLWLCFATTRPAALFGVPQPPIRWDGSEGQMVASFAKEWRSSCKTRVRRGLATLPNS